ncbi:MAG: B12-binding domain-containing radical SAM protein [Candidatus Omnitrophica bacterium]|nr:B12-binding domain-containing radical SAM protein [Candidatus Omnitrophota bacterium]MBU1133605.1 B12-binding domain-containing radical SAM protein [Candidatus Omnitrophota bacterium]
MSYELRAKKVLLVQPNYRLKEDASIWGVSPPMSLCYIASMLEKEGIYVEILDANVCNLSPQEICDYAIKIKADIVGVSILTPAHNSAVKIAQSLPKEIISVAGGPHASSLPKELLNDGFDVVVRGEGEFILLELAQGRSWQDILGISFKKNGNIAHNSPRPLADPNTIPYPARHLLIKNGCDKPYFSEGTRHFPWAQVYSSRGCPYDCCYCNKSISGYRFRPRSAEDVLGEIEYLVRNYGIKEINFSDDTFNLDVERAQNILDGIIKANFKLCLRFSNGLRIDRINPELLEKMKQAGTEYIAYGIESGEQAILDRIPKDIKLERVKEVVRMTKKLGIEVTGFFMFGLLGDTVQSMQKTIDFAKSLNLDIALFNIAIPYPGTKMYEEIKKKGEFLVKDWSEFYHTSGKMIYVLDGMAHPKEVETMYRKANREFYLRPGYIAKKTLSAIVKGKLPLMLKGAKRVIYSQR